MICPACEGLEMVSINNRLRHCAVGLCSCQSGGSAARLRVVRCFTKYVLDTRCPFDGPCHTWLCLSASHLRRSRPVAFSKAILFCRACAPSGGAAVRGDRYSLLSSLLSFFFFLSLGRSRLVDAIPKTVIVALVLFYRGEIHGWSA